MSSSEIETTPSPLQEWEKIAKAKRKSEAERSREEEWKVSRVIDIVADVRRSSTNTEPLINLDALAQISMTVIIVTTAVASEVYRRLAGK